MKVNKIQSKNNINQNFRALRLKPGAAKYLNSMPDKVLNKLDSVGEYLSDTKYYHLDIAPNEFHISHNNGERLYLPILVNNAGKVLLIKLKQGMSQITMKLKYPTEKEPKLLTEKIKSASTQLERTAEIIKVLDEYEIKLNKNEQDVIINHDESREVKIEKLLKKYSL